MNKIFLNLEMSWAMMLPTGSTHIHKPHSYWLYVILNLLVTLGYSRASIAQGPQTPSVEWYQPETSKGDYPGRAIIHISGRTQPAAIIEIDLRSISVVRATGADDARRVQQTFTKDIAPGSEIQRGLSNSDGYFEISVELPQGLIQIPIVVISRTKAQKAFQITFDVSVKKPKISAPVSRNNPPAASKNVRIWFGLGMTYQKYTQTISNATNVSLQNYDSPSILGRLGYWGKTWGVDFFYRDAPGKIDSAVEPFVIASSNYHWTTYELRGSYRVDRGNGSRVFGLPSQWQILFGTQIHHIPFLDINSSNLVNIKAANLTMATAGVGLLLGQEKKWSYEFALEYQYPLAASGADGNSFSVSSPIAYDARVGTNYKLNSNWRLGIYTYLQSHSYTFNFTDSTTGNAMSGKQSLLYSTLDAHIGYEF